MKGYRFYLGFAGMALGGLMVEHYITYGGLLHLAPGDHGLIGLAIIVASGLLAGLRPGRKAK